MNENDILEHLRTVVRPGITVYTILRGVSRSGMSRRIDFLIWNDGPQYLTWHIATLHGYRLTREDGAVINGAGMDMGFHAVMNLSYRLHGMSDAEVIAALERAGYSPAMAREHVDAGRFRPGYTLTHRWL